MNLRKWKIFFFGVLISICLMGAKCASNDTTESDKISQSEIYQSYSIEPIGDQLNVTAFFRIGGESGTTLALMAPSKITFNNQPLPEHRNTISGTFYSIEVPRNITEGSFAFTDRDGKTYTNSIDLTQTSWRPAIQKIEASKPVSIPFTQRLDPEKSSLELQLKSLSQTDKSETIYFAAKQPSNSEKAAYDASINALIINPSAWEEIPRGLIEAQVKITVSSQLQQGTHLGGKIWFQYPLPIFKTSLQKPGKAKPQTLARKENPRKSVQN